MATLRPKAEDFPRIRGALTFYRVCSIITGVMLLLLCAEMIVKYAVGFELFAFGSSGFLVFAPVAHTPEGLQSTGTGLNLSTGVLIAHGWFYVVYLFSAFRIWSLMRWPFWRFIVLAAAGVVPFLSFVLEVLTAREVQRYLRDNAPQEPVAAGAAA